MERIRLIQAFVVIRITYPLPYWNPSKSELEKVSRLIRWAYKAALPLPLNTSTARREGRGILYTAEELSEGAHVVCLSKTPTGHHIHKLLGVTTLEDLEAKSPLSRHVNTIHNAGRSEQRIRALRKLIPIRLDEVCVDAAEYRHCNAYTIAAIIDPDNPTAEEAAIALALL